MKQELDGVLAYKLGKALQLFSDELALYDKSRDAILDKYAIKDEKGKVVNNDGMVTIQKDKIEIYNEEMLKLNNLTIELNVPELQLENLTALKLTPQEANSLDWWIKKLDPQEI